MKFQACIKITNEIRQTNGLADHAVANSLCAQDNTRLAVVETLDERTGLAAWINKVYTPTADVRPKYFHPRHNPLTFKFNPFLLTLINSKLHVLRLFNHRKVNMTEKS